MSNPRVAIEHGRNFPYNDRQPADKYELATLGVLANLCDRRGIKHELQNTDADIREEIVTTLAAIIRDAVNS